MGAAARRFCQIEPPALRFFSAGSFAAFMGR